MNTKNAIKYIIVFVIYGFMFYLFSLLYSIIIIIIGALISIFIYAYYDYQRKEKRLAIKSKIKSILLIILVILPIIAGGSSILSKKLTCSSITIYSGPSSYRTQVDTFISNFNFGENLKYNGSTPAKDFYGNYFSISDAAINTQKINSTFPILPLGTNLQQIFNVTYKFSANSSIFFQKQVYYYQNYQGWNVSINGSSVYKINPKDPYTEWWENDPYGLNMYQNFTFPNFSGIYVQIYYYTSSDFYVALFQGYNIFAMLDTSGNPLIVVGNLIQ